MKLRTKFSVLNSFLIIAVILGVSVFLFIAEKRLLIQEMEENQTNIIKGLAQVGRESLITNDEILLINYVNLIKRTRGVMYALVTDAQGKVLAHSDVGLLGTIGDDTTAIKARSSNKFITQSYVDDKKQKVLDFALPIFIDRNKAGIARIGFSQDSIHQIVEETLRETRKRIFGVAVVMLIIGFVGAIILAQMMTKPIKQMAKGAELIGQGKLDTEIVVKSKDELESLATDLNKMSSQLKEIDQMKKDFLASVTHELKSPLTSLIMYIDLFLTGAAGKLNEKAKKFLRIMERNSNRLSRFIDDLLDMARIERGKMEIKRESLGILPIVSETVELMKPQADEKNIEIAMNIPDDLPLVFVDGDRTRQIITNLLSNSIKFTPEEGKISIKIQDDKKYLQLSLSDTGIGIPPEHINKIFDKFEQVREVRERVKGPRGTGLGLAIVKYLVEAQGGKIWVESEVGKGSTFYFTLPKQIM
ncbi:HAMP domain-containing protein [bacterium]|nr:HAMP domain-containing protein [bacterium]NIO18843.1 HAMP domain-containing protein [bacterium]